MIPSAHRVSNAIQSVTRKNHEYSRHTSVANARTFCCCRLHCCRRRNFSDKDQICSGHQGERHGFDRFERKCAHQPYQSGKTERGNRNCCRPGHGEPHDSGGNGVPYNRRPKLRGRQFCSCKSIRATSSACAKRRCGSVPYLLLCAGSCCRSKGMTHPQRGSGSP